MADKGPARGEGVGVIEAPRGTLFHHYRRRQGRPRHLLQSHRLDHQQQSGDERVDSRRAARYLTGREVTEGLPQPHRVAIRAYDPCLSCATHALGQMPLEVELVDPDGALVSRVRRG